MASLRLQTGRAGSGLAGEGAMGQAVELLYSYMDDESALTAIEYGLIAGIISIAIASVAMQIGVSLQLIFEQATKY
jgi:Flp pilus assembly pilin Flp